MKDAVAPAATVSGVVNPESVYPVPVMVAPEMVTLAPPVFVRTPVSDCVVPVCTEPKLKLLLCGLNVPVGVAVPVPDREKLNEPFGALLVMANVPVEAPVACGA